LIPIITEEATRVGSGRRCGECSLCCKVAIVPELQKAGGAWCSHAKPGQREGGCTVYGSDRRPAVCGRFSCAWLEGVMPEPMRPDRIHAYIAATKDGKGAAVHVDTQHPDAWRTGALADWINRTSMEIRVVVRVGASEWTVYRQQLYGKERPH
jgi:hypothetical protein